MDSKIKIVPRTLSTLQAAEYLGVAEISLRQGRCDGYRQGRMQPPPYCRIGRKILYLRDDLDKWLESHRVDLMESPQVGGRHG
jgi:hypothetical protein